MSSGHSAAPNRTWRTAVRSCGLMGFLSSCVQLYLSALSASDATLLAIALLLLACPAAPDKGVSNHDVIKYKDTAKRYKNNTHVHVLQTLRAAEGLR